MSLKRQLLLVSLLMLLVPLAAVKFALELDAILRQQAQQQLQQQANRLAILAGDELLGQPPLAPTAAVVYVPAQHGTLLLDGYADDWPGYGSAVPFPPPISAPLSPQQPWQHLPTAPPSQAPQLYWQASHSDSTLFLLIRIHGQTPQLFNPGTPQQSHHRLQLQLYNGTGNLNPQRRAHSWQLRPSAPGRLPAATGQDWANADPNVTAFWQPITNGWQVELAMPRPAPGARLAMTLYQNPANESVPTAQATVPTATLISRDPDLEQALQSWLETGQQVRLMENSGWVIAHQPHSTFKGLPDTGTPNNNAANQPSWPRQIGQNLLQALVKANQPQARTVADQLWRQPTGAASEQVLVRHSDGSLWLSAQAAVFGGRTLVLEQSLDQLLGISGAALGAILGRSLLIILGLIFVLLGYASWLSWQISRLAKQVTHSVDSDGRINKVLPPHSPIGARDNELGQLQHTFAQLIGRLQGYNQYLESFSQRLSHELKTPLAILHSSLDNLGHSDPTDQQQPYLERAQGAVGRLSRILHSMSEATRLEQSLERVDQEPFDWAEVLSQTCAAYQALDPQHQIVYLGPSRGCPVRGSAELLVQLLDKLVDNARDFTPQGQRIELNLTPAIEGWQLSVFNQGSQLPDSADIFSAFVSHRKHQAPSEGEHHLGQGLLIAQLIARHHQATLSGSNHHRNGMLGVQFCLTIPVDQTAQRQNKR